MVKSIIKVGQQFEQLTVIKEVDPQISPTGRKRRRFLFECSCGNQAEKTLDKVTSGQTRSCGCLKGRNGGRKKKTPLQKEREKQLQETDYRGFEFNSFTVLKRHYKREEGTGQVLWNCSCNCGNTLILSEYQILTKSVFNCGPYHDRPEALKGAYIRFC